MWGGLALIVVIAIVLILVFTLKSDDKSSAPTDRVTEDPFYISSLEGTEPYNNTFLISNRLTHPDGNVRYSLANDLPPSIPENRIADTIKGTVLLTSLSSLHVSFDNLRNTNFSANADNYATADASIPQEIVNTTDAFSLIKPPISLSDAGFQFSQNPFGWYQQLPGADTPIFDTRGHALLMYDKFIEITWDFATDNIFGLGERIHPLNLGNGTYTMWNSPQTHTQDKGNGTGNLYGSHPFYLNYANGVWVGVYVANAYAASGYITGRTVTHRAIGGNLDVFVWHGTSAQEVLKQYHARIGQTFLPPLWSLGIHQSRYGYEKLDTLKEVVANYTAAGIPLDGLWSDIDYMDGGKDFTLNTNYAGLKDEVTAWAAQGIHWVPILFPWLPKDENYQYYKDLLEQKGAIMGNGTDMPFSGKNAGMDTVYFDLWNSGAQSVWVAGVNDLFSNIAPFDGLWLDQNEPENDDTTPTTDILYDLIYYTPGGRNLSSNIVHVDAKYNVTDLGNKSYNVYDLHTMYGAKQSQLMSGWMGADSTPFKAAKKRAFLVSRSTFPGSGKFGGHQTGPNNSTFESMMQSVDGVLNFNMFGVAMTGAYVCGHDSNATDDLCARWYQLAAFQPLLRNHNTKGTVAQEPWAFDTNMTLYAARGAALQRYQWLQTLYELFLDAHSDGGAVVQPTFFQFPEERLMNSTSDYQKSFMWGDILLITPCLQAGVAATANYTAYVPMDIWYNATDRLFPKLAATGDVSMPATLNKTNVFLRGGSIVNWQNVTMDELTTTVKSVKDLVQKPVEVIIAPDAKETATRAFSIDDGEELGLTTLKEYTLQYENRTLRVEITSGLGNTALPWQTTTAIRVLNAAASVSDTAVVCARYINMTDAPLMVSKDGPNLVMALSDNSAFDVTELRYAQIVDAGEPNPCMTQAVAESAPVPISSGSGSQVNLTNTGTPSRPANKLGVVAPAKLTLTAQLFNTTKMDQKNRVIQVNITDAEKQRFTVPLATSDSMLTVSDENIDSHFTINQTPFFFQSLNPADPTDVEVTSSAQLLVFEDKYIEVELLIASNGQYWGLGDRATPDLWLSPGIYTSYAFDTPTPIETGKVPGNNMYGVHSVLFTRLLNGRWLALFNNNANAQDWILENSGNATFPLRSRFVSIGGVVDMYVITGESIQEVVQTYHELIGRPVLPPLYAFGYNQCRWGYRSKDDLNKIYELAKNNSFPLDGLWTDIDYMDNYADFTIDEARYPGFKDWVTNTLNADGVQFIPIIDAGVSANMTDTSSLAYQIYQSGVQDDAFIFSGYTDKPLIGEVWPGKAVFPNHLPQSKGAQWWADQLKSFHDNLVPFGGLWLDMNEASNFCPGECPLEQSYKLVDPAQDYNLLYNPGMRSLSDKSLSLNAYGMGGDGMNYTQFDTHSLFGYLEMKSTRDMMVQTLQKRPYIISRSTYAGAGRWGSHWLGDNFSQWKYLQVSIPMVMNFNMYGITLVGADICGFNGNTTPELCTRWMQLGAFYPFMRNHNSWETVAQEPWAFEQQYMEAMRDATYLRYTLLRYLYSAYFEVSMNGGALFRPRFFRWEDDANVYSAAADNFLYGDALMVTPVLQEGQSSMDVYFPEAGAWVNHADGTVLNLMSAQNATFQVGLNSMFVWQMPGTIVTYQSLGGSKKNITQTSKLQGVNTGLRVALAADNTASGFVIFDDGVTLPANNTYWKIGMSFADMALSFKIEHNDSYAYDKQDQYLSYFYVYGMQTAPNNATLHYADDSKASVDLTVVYDEDDKSVFVHWDTMANPASFAAVRNVTFA